MVQYVSSDDIDLDHDVLIDVRSPSEYDAAHIPGSYNIPLDELREHRSVLRHVSNGVLLCRTDNRSSQAWKTMKGIGADVSVLKNGVNAWQDSDGDMVFGETTTWSIQRQVQFTAGTLIFLSTALGTLTNDWFYMLAAFIGAGLTIAGATGTCGLARVLSAAPWNKSGNHAEHIKKIKQRVETS